ncbi:MAG: hypothetical protein Q8L97_09880 [Nitrosomonas sp.]|uniref:DUF6792 domain-containing protein n=2 Tax=Pseudomonadati TaxID=3379134 RepID=UPI002730884B|nr:DUF6792 domain-containing protein [Nitrosomonas sp.]MDP1550452.1 hypothetical protein [Nitrosomonas sp.]
MKTIIFLVLLLLLTGCGALKTLKAYSNEYDKPDANTAVSFFKDNYSQTLATRFGLMALFSELVYMRHLEGDRSKIDECAVNNSLLDKKFYIPPALPTSTIQEGFWSRWRPNDGDSIPACYSHEGLFYDTFVFTDKRGDIVEAVIAFRGTENRTGEMLKDWMSNISPFFGFEPAQYQLAKGLIPKLIEALRKDSPGVRIYTTGHSLGGGLAQQAGFLSREVSEIVTFNTSPVTNWTHLRLEKKVDKKYPIIYRLYHGGEGLEKARFITSTATDSQYGRHDISVQYEPRSSFTGHSMKIIACAFAKLIASRDNNQEVADHYYEPHYIKQELLSEGRMCFDSNNSVTLR